METENKQMGKQLWNKGFDPDQNIERFTVGADRRLDLRLARYDVIGSMAHIRMLCSIGLLTQEELDMLLPALEDIKQMIDRGEFVIEDGVEDVHSQVELMLTARLGHVGKKIHSGRSRNDQVLVDLKLFFRDELKSIAAAVSGLFDRLLELSEEHKDKLMPGYTHLQVSFPLDRDMTTRLLGFARPHFNVVAAQMSRGKTERAVAAAIASIASTLGHLAMDVCMWMCGNFGFVSCIAHCQSSSGI